MSRPRITIRRLMAAVVIVAPFFLLLRGDPRSSQSAGAMIVASCVVVLAWKLASEELGRRQAKGQPIGRLPKIGIGLKSLVLALMIIGSADFGFIFVYFLVPPAHSHPPPIDTVALLLGLLASALAVYPIRRWLRRKRESPPPSKPEDFLLEVNPDGLVSRPEPPPGDQG